MAAAANYGRPKPVDPIWYRRRCYIRIWCGCGRQTTELLGAFAVTRGLPDTMKLYQLAARLRCTACDRRPDMEVSRGMIGF